MSIMNVRVQYPRSEEFDYETILERINLDDERLIDLTTGNGFTVTASRAIKDDVKDYNGIFSTRYGQTLQDMDAFANRYKCKCGRYKGRFFNGNMCENCGTPVTYVDDNFQYFGWITLKDPYHVIHPNLYKALSFFIGAKRLDAIMLYVGKRDQDGNEINFKRPKDEPFLGIGMIDFYDRFDEIMDFYLSKNPAKQDYYNDIMANRNAVFIQNVPVFTTHLRPYRIEGGTMHYEGTNAKYNMMAKLALTINNDKLKITSKTRPKVDALYDFQCKYNELYDEILNIISGKKGSVRQLFGGRYNFTARSVIVPNPNLKIDEVTLSYQCLVGLLQQVIINILCKSYNMTYDQAYKVLYFESMTAPNEKICAIIDGLIRDSGRGIPILINRNPTISYGGILQMYVVGISTGYTMGMPLQCLTGMGADFDGDTLNIMYIINKEFLYAAENTFNPRNAMYISKNDGYFNNDYNHQRDTLVNANGMINLSRSLYSQDQIDLIRKIKDGAK